MLILNQCIIDPKWQVTVIKMEFMSKSEEQSNYYQGSDESL